MPRKISTHIPTRRLSREFASYLTYHGFFSASGPRYAMSAPATPQIVEQPVFVAGERVVYHAYNPLTGQAQDLPGVVESVIPGSVIVKFDGGGRKIVSERYVSKESKRD